MRTRRAAAGPLCAVLAGIAALPVTAVSASGAGPTTVRHLSPVDPAGRLKPAYRIAHRHGHAGCQSGSFMTGSAYRCTSPGSAAVVLDPCWVAASPRTAICMTKPWKHEVIQLAVTGGYDTTGGFRHVRLPWGLQLGPHLRCLRDAGSVRSLHGHALLYHCSRKHDVFGPLRRGSQPWRAHLFRLDHSRSGYRSEGWRGVEVAWRGGASRPAG